MEYWDQRYSEGGNSGRGSTGKYRRWKLKIIKKYVPKLSNVVDVGCGDLKFWGWFLPRNYVGLDISETIIERNRGKHPRDRFIHSSAETLILGLKAPVVLCIDLLFHIMDDETYNKILENLCRYSTEFIFIYTWHTNPWETRVTDGVYQMFRKFEEHLHIIEERGFKLIEVSPSPHDMGAMYIFQSSTVGR